MNRLELALAYGKFAENVSERIRWGEYVGVAFVEARQRLEKRYGKETAKQIIEYKLIMDKERLDKDEQRRKENKEHKDENTEIREVHQICNKELQKQDK